MDIRHGQLRRTTVPDYSGFRMATPDGYSGLLLRRTTSGLLRMATPATGVLSALPKDQSGLWETTY